VTGKIEIEKSMWKLIAVFSTVAMTGLASAQAQTPAWQDYRSADGAFHVEMPGKPTVTPGIDHNVFALFGKGAFVVRVSEITGPYLTAPADSNLDRVRDIAANAAHGTVLSEIRETLGGLPARRVKIDVLNGAVMTERIVIKKNYLYQVGVTGPAGYSDGADAKRFLDSFALTP
jgi:hypothetical protein